MAQPPSHRLFRLTKGHIYAAQLTSASGLCCGSVTCRIGVRQYAPPGHSFYVRLRVLALCLLTIPCALKTLEFCADRFILAGMCTILSAIVSLVSFRFRRRASLELEVLALRHQVAVLHRQRPGRTWLCQGDRLLWAWLYRAWSRCLKVMVLVKPVTVLQWHRQGFRRYWRWRSISRPVGRPGVNRKICDLIRQMSVANPFWGCATDSWRNAKTGHRSQPGNRRQTFRRPRNLQRSPLCGEPRQRVQNPQCK